MTNICSLFPPLEDRRDIDNYLSALLDDAVGRAPQNSVTPSFDFSIFKHELSAFDFERPEDIKNLLCWTVRQMEGGIIQLNHPRYLGLFNPAPSFPSQCADRIVSTFNPQLATALTSPAAVEIEAHVIRLAAQRAGLGAQAAGHFTSGGSEANFTAMICALTAAERDFATIGSRAFSGQPVFYASQDSHLGWIKIAHQAGIGRSAARMVPTDGNGRMCIDALNIAIHEDLIAGHVPFMIVATAGTTNAGMVDPLNACANAAHAHGLWYHVDAAWGGALIASECLRGLLAGIEKADSITIDAHKWFATTMGCGMFLTAHPSTLSAAFNVAASFMSSQMPAIDPYLLTVQWSRRFLGLRLFLSLAAGGWEAHANHVEQAFDLIESFKARIGKLGWHISNGDSTLAVACIEPPEGSKPVADIVTRIVASGQAWISTVMFEGRSVVRVCAPNAQTSQDDIAMLIVMLERARENVPAK